MLARIIVKEPFYGMNPCSASELALHLSGSGYPTVILGVTQPPITKASPKVIIYQE